MAIPVVAARVVANLAVAVVAANLVVAVAAAKVVEATAVDAVAQVPVVAAVGLDWCCQEASVQAPQALEARRSFPLLEKQ